MTSDAAHAAAQRQLEDARAWLERLLAQNDGSPLYAGRIKSAEIAVGLALGRLVEN